MNETPDLENPPEGLVNPEQEKTKPIDALVIFGGGSISDRDLVETQRGKSLVSNQEKGWRLPIMAKLRLIAATELYKNGQVEDIIFSEGTRTSEGMTVSGAELMKDYFLKKLEYKWRSDLIKEYETAEGNIRDTEGQIRSDIQQKIDEIVDTRLKDASGHVLLEDKATNTIENFAYTANFIDANQDKYQNIAFLSSDFHISRIKKIAEKIKISGQGFGSETIIDDSGLDERYKKVAQNYFNPDKNRVYREQILQDLSGEEKTVFEKRLGMSAAEYTKGEKRWSRGLDEIPEYWLQNIQFIKDPEQLKRILKAEQGVQEVLAKNGIVDIDEASEEEIRAALEKIERIMPPKEWEE